MIYGDERRHFAIFSVLSVYVMSGCRAVYRAGGHHRVGKVGVPDEIVVARIEQLIVPPFVPVKIPTRGRHDAHQQVAVTLRLGGDAGVAVVGERRESVESGAHVEVVARCVDQRQINGDAPRMG